LSITISKKHIYWGSVSESSNKKSKSPQKKGSPMEKRQILCSAVLLLSMGAADATLSSVIEHRSQSSNNARKVAGEFGYVHLRDQDEWYMRSASAFEYQRTFRSDRLAQSLFGCFVDDCGNLLIQGSAVADRDPNALLADYFYLPTDYNSVVSVKPVITDLIFDYDLYVGFNCRCIENAYFRLYTPLVRSKWALNMNECVSLIGTGTVTTPGTNPYAAGYFTPCPLDRDELNTDFCSYLNGSAPQIQCATILKPLCDVGGVRPLGTELATTVFNPLSYYNACCNGSHTATTLADLRMELGWNFWNTEKYRLGINTQVAFPTGTRPNAQYMFNPVVGNGKHWEFGGGVIGDYIFWQCGDMEKSFGINLDANLTYMFDNKEQRTFDLVGNELSRFMLAARVGQPFAISAGAMAAGDTIADATVPCGQFKYEYTPVANLTTLDIKVKNALQADIAIWLNYTNRRFSADLGYNLWARSHDEIIVRENCNDCPNICDRANRDTWVLKGCTQEYGFIDGATVGGDAPCPVIAGACNANFAVPLSPSASTATITSCGALDNPELAFGNLTGNALARAELFVDPQALVGQVSTSNSPVYIRCEDIDLCARPRGISNKVWANLQWTWDLDRDCNPLRCKPFLGLGGEVEFGITNSDCGDDCGSTCESSSSCANPCSSSSSSCGPCGNSDRISVAASQWGIWLKGGLNFE
jgi:hypothetical protein